MNPPVLSPILPSLLTMVAEMDYDEPPLPITSTSPAAAILQSQEQSDQESSNEKRQQQQQEKDDEKEDEEEHMEQTPPADQIPPDDDAPLLLGATSSRIQVKREPRDDATELDDTTAQPSKSKRRKTAASPIVGSGWLMSRSERLIEAARIRSQVKFEKEALRRYTDEQNSWYLRYALDKIMPPRTPSPHPFEQTHEAEETAELFAAEYEVESIDDWKIEYDPATQCEQLLYLLKWKGYPATFEHAENPNSYEDLLDELELRQGRPVPRVKVFIKERDAKLAAKSGGKSQPKQKTSSSKSTAKRKRSKSRSNTETSSSVHASAAAASSSTSIFASSPVPAVASSCRSSVDLTNDSDTEDEATPSEADLPPTPQSQRKTRLAESKVWTASSSVSSSTPSSASSSPRKRQRKSGQTAARKTHSPSVRRLESYAWQPLEVIRYPVFQLSSQEDVEDESLAREAALRYNYFYPSNEFSLSSQMRQFLSSTFPDLYSSASTLSSTKHRLQRIGVKREDDVTPFMTESDDPDEKKSVDADHETENDKDANVNDDDEEEQNRPRKRQMRRQSSISADEMLLVDTTSPTYPLHLRHHPPPTSHPYTVQEMDNKLSIVRQMIAMQHQPPQAVFDWLINRILESPTSINLQTSGNIYGFLCSALRSHPQWYPLSSHHIKLVSRIFEFLTTTLPAVIAHAGSAPPVPVDATGTATSLSLAELRQRQSSIDEVQSDRLRVHEYVSMLQKYTLVVRLIYQLYAHDMTLTHEFNEEMQRLHQRLQNLVPTAASSTTATTCQFEPVMDEEYAVYSQVLSYWKARTGSSSSGAPHLRSALRWSLQHASTITLFDFRLKQLLPLSSTFSQLLHQFEVTSTKQKQQNRHSSSSSSNDDVAVQSIETLRSYIPISLASNFFEIIDQGWIELISQMDKFKL